MSKMNAIKVVASNELSFVEQEIFKPGEGEVLIKVHAAGMCGTDLEVFSCKNTYYRDGRAKLPLIPGHEWAGEIVELGTGVENFSIGDKVTGECTLGCGECELCKNGHFNVCSNRKETGIMNKDGGYAQYIVFPAKHLFKFDEKVSYEEGACIEPTCIAYHSLKRANLKESDTVLVVGPGPIGLLAAQIAKKVFKAKKVMLSGTRTERLERAADYGLDGIINVRNEDLETGVMEITGGERVDIIIDAAGAKGFFNDALKIIKPAGRIVLVAFPEQYDELDWTQFAIQEIDLIGALGSPSVWPEVIELIESGKIDVKSIISHVLPMTSLESFEDALDVMVKRRDNACKVILRPWEE